MEGKAREQQSNSDKRQGSGPQLCGVARASRYRREAVCRKGCSCVTAEWKVALIYCARPQLLGVGTNIGYAWHDTMCAQYNVKYLCVLCWPLTFTLTHALTYLPHSPSFPLTALRAESRACRSNTTLSQPPLSTFRMLAATVLAFPWPEQIGRPGHPRVGAPYVSTLRPSKCLTAQSLTRDSGRRVRDSSPVSLRCVQISLGFYFNQRRTMAYDLKRAPNAAASSEGPKRVCSRCACT